MNKKLKKHLIDFLTDLVYIEREESVEMDDLCINCYDIVSDCSRCCNLYDARTTPDEYNNFDQKEREYLLKELLWLKDKKC